MNNDKNIYQDELNRFVRFDWALKYILRDKANFGVLEGLVTVLLDEQIHIIELLESELAPDGTVDKFNRVDIKAKNSKEEIIIVKIRLIRLMHYIEDIFYNKTKAITEDVTFGDKYNKVKKVYSISVVYFDLGKGSDYLYHGQNLFTGIHTKDELRINTKEYNVIRMRTPEEIFPEYYIIRVKEFNRVATTPLEDWIDYLKTGNIRRGTKAPGLEEAREKLQYLSMDKVGRDAYYRYMSAVMVQNDVFETAMMDGRAEGRAEGLAESRAEGVTEEKSRTAKSMKEDGIPAATISKYTGLSIDEIDKL